MDVLTRNNISLSGSRQAQPIIFAHGFGCDQAMWRYVAPEFEESHFVVLFDHVGAGQSSIDAYDRHKYSSLEGYAQDIIEICETLDLEKVIFVGHSVASMMGVLAARMEPDLFEHLILVGPSPRYLDDDGYTGGFSADEISDLLRSLESNYLGWSSQMAPLIMGNEDRPELGEELTNNFCRTDPDIAAHFASVTFTSDNRDDLPLVDVPTLVLQCSNDVLAPDHIGEYVHASLPMSTFMKLDAVGHCPNLSAPEETTAAIKSYLAS